MPYVVIPYIVDLDGWCSSCCEFVYVCAGVHMFVVFMFMVGLGRFQMCLRVVLYVFIADIVDLICLVSFCFDFCLRVV